MSYRGRCIRHRELTRKKAEPVETFAEGMARVLSHLYPLPNRFNAASLPFWTDKHKKARKP